MGIAKYINTYYERAIIGIKQSNEYRINFWMMNFFDFFHLITMVLFFSVLASTSDAFLNWNLIDIVIYWCINLITWKMMWFFNFLGFDRRLLKGELNNHILRPISTFFLTGIERFSGNNLISQTYLIPIAIGFIIYNGYNFTIFNVFFIIFSWFYFVVLFNAITSFAFFMKNVGIIFDPFDKVDEVVWRFTPKLFSSSKFKHIFYLFPSAVQSYLVLMLLKGEFNLVLIYLPYLLSSFVFFIILTFVLWHFGLKKYEAYN